jgi:hypothetical protein
VQTEHEKPEEETAFLPKRKLSLFRCTADFFICHKFLTKRSKKGLDFSGQDEYNTLSTQRNGVLKNQRADTRPFGHSKVLNYIFTIGGQEL